MGLKATVKVSDVTNLSNARYCAGMGVELLGFNLNESSPQYVSPTQFQDIVGWVAGVSIVGEFDLSTNVVDIKLASQSYALDYLQIEDIDLLEELSELSISFIFKLKLEDLDSIKNLESLVETILAYTNRILVSSTNSDLFPEIDKAISQIASKAEWIKGYDVQLGNIETILAQKMHSGIELQGADEERPGFNDYGDVMDILEALDED